jgi:superfamily II DNA/RNA helicase
MADNSDSDKQESKQVFDSCKALIISPTRELAMQIRDMISAVIPVDYQ